VKVSWAAFVCLAGATTVAAAGPTAERCQQGLDFAAKNDLPHAALYLEGCDQLTLPEDVAANIARTKAAVAHKLDESKLSAISIVTTPEGMIAETDAMPGERFTTPATIWTKAGDYKVNVAIDAAALDAGTGISTAISLAAFSRRTVLLDVPQPKKTPPKDGKVDFNDEPTEAANTHKGPPPAQKFGSILPKKYRKPTGESSGPQLEDPLAYRESTQAWRLGARVGGGVLLRNEASASFAVAALASRPLAGPVELQTRLGWTHRDVDVIAVEVGVGFALVNSTSLTLTAVAAARGDVRLQDHLDMDEVSRVGIGATAGLDLALAAAPIVIGLRFEPMLTELTPGVRAHGLMLELGYDWR